MIHACTVKTSSFLRDNSTEHALSPPSPRSQLSSAAGSFCRPTGRGWLATRGNIIQVPAITQSGVPRTPSSNTIYDRGEYSTKLFALTGTAKRPSFVEIVIGACIVHTRIVGRIKRVVERRTPDPVLSVKYFERKKSIRADPAATILFGF